MIDKDHSGAISIKELKEALGVNLSEADWKEIIAEADENGDGEISFEEFKNLMMKMDFKS